MQTGSRLSGLVVATLVLASPGAEAGIPSGFQSQVIARNLSSPTTMAIADDGRIFVAEQAGRIRVVKGNRLLTRPFLDISSRIDAVGERGLLGIAFDPDFASNRWVYVYYTAKTPTIRNRVSRFTARGDVAVPGSEKVLLNMQPLSGATNHNGGAIQFGQDGKLYIAVGDNNDGSNAQRLSNVKGKILRINKGGSIPGDNPFFNRTTGINRSIWALGLRNPFSFAFQPGTGRMLINDVGASSWEEINLGRRGANYGWPDCEGPTCPNPQFQKPFFAYQHGSGTSRGCAIVGAAFYNPETLLFPRNYLGQYFFGDLCNGWIRRINPNNRRVNLFATGLNQLVDLRVANSGELFYLQRVGGKLTRVTYNP